MLCSILRHFNIIVTSISFANRNLIANFFLKNFNGNFKSRSHIHILRPSQGKLCQREFGMETVNFIAKIGENTFANMCKYCHYFVGFQRFAMNSSSAKITINLHDFNLHAGDVITYISSFKHENREYKNHEMPFGIFWLAHYFSR